MHSAYRFLIGLALLLGVRTTLGAGEALEPAHYTENFETRELRAWASYPLWQDTAFDSSFRVDTIVPGDPNLSLVQRVTPYTPVDNYAGAQKQLDLWLTPGSTIRCRYYLKSQLDAESLMVRLAAGADGAVDYVIAKPATNRWVPLTLTYKDIAKVRPELRGRNLRMNALALLAKFPNADPAMPIYFGLDDIDISASREAHFRFASPAMHHLAEWRPYIAARHYRAGEVLPLKGTWPVSATRVTLTVAPYTEQTKIVSQSELTAQGETWNQSLPLNFAPGLYLAKLRAFQKDAPVANTEFTFVIAPADLGGKHPRLWFTADTKAAFLQRLSEPRFATVNEDIRKRAKETRAKTTLAKVVFDFDQYPPDEALLGGVPPTLYPWFERIDEWRAASFFNAQAYAFYGDQAAGTYAKDLLLKVSTFPFWTHPWFETRGQHTYYLVGLVAGRLALTYDLIYDLLSPAERAQIRQAFVRNVIAPAHQGYVVGNSVSTHTSNWVGHVTGGSLMAMASIYGDGPELAEPYFTGAIFKHFEQIQRSIGRDGGYGEGWGYYRFSMSSWSETVPTYRELFQIDMTGRLDGSYTELIWSSRHPEQSTLYFGDSSGGITPLFNWAWLLRQNRDPLLAWFYRHQKKAETMMDVLFPTNDITPAEISAATPVRCFRDVGTTVFKSGWGKEDFVFSLRTGAFFNHQHLDQGTFWLADQGVVFIGERHDSDYYTDPIYQSHYIQPISHSTILIDGNAQSQRTGDPLEFAPGFDAHAFVAQHLDGRAAAFTSGDIGRLYWGKVQSLQRNVLYLKPRTLLMLDTIVPATKDLDVTLLYQTEHLRDIQPGARASTITKQGKTLHFGHLHPTASVTKAVETPHYIKAFKQYPLEKEGMLTLTARATSAQPLTIANLLTTDDALASVTWREITGGRHAKLGTQDVAFATAPDRHIKTDTLDADALAVVWDEHGVFAALCRRLMQSGKTIFYSDQAVTIDWTPQKIRYEAPQGATVRLAASAAPKAVVLNGQPTKFTYVSGEHVIILKLAPGSGMIQID